MTDSEALYFYPPKFKNILLLIVIFLFLALGILAFFGGFKNEVYGLVVSGAFLTLMFGLLAIPLLKRALGSEPYLILKEDELVLSVYPKDAVSIEWKDIYGFNMLTANMNRSIELKVRHEDSYLGQLSKVPKWLNTSNTYENYRAFAIQWGQLKSKDRQQVIQALDKRVFAWDEQYQKDYDFDGNYEELYEKILDDHDTIRKQIDQDKKKQKEWSQLDGQYLRNAYAISLSIAGVLFLLSLLAGDSSELELFIVISIVYPYGKMVWDLLAGFKFSYKISQDDSTMSQYLELLHLLIHFIIYFLSIFLAPFGILYCMVKVVRRQFKKHKEKAQGEGILVEGASTADKSFDNAKVHKASLQIPFFIRFAVFPLHIGIILGLAHLFIALNIENWFVMAAILFVGLTFGVYVALYPGERDFVSSILAFLWRITICYVIELGLIWWTTPSGQNAIPANLVLSLPLFLLPSHVFYSLEKTKLRQLF